MATELIVNASLPETRIALMEDGEIQEVLIERASGKGIVGNIYKGRVTRVLPGMQAAFVDIGLEKAAFLYVDDVFVHSDIWAEEEGDTGSAEGVGAVTAAVAEAEGVTPAQVEAAANELEPEADAETDRDAADAEAELAGEEEDYAEFSEEEEDEIEAAAEDALNQHPELLTDEEAEEQMAQNLRDLEEEEEEEEEEDEDDNGDGPVGMGPGPDDEDSDHRPPAGTIAPPREGNERTANASEGSAGGEGPVRDAPAGDAPAGDGPAGEGMGGEGEGRRRRHRRGRRGGRNRRRGRELEGQEGQRTAGTQSAPGIVPKGTENYPESYYEQVSEAGDVQSDRALLGADTEKQVSASADEADVHSGRPEITPTGGAGARIIPVGKDGKRPEFKEPRGRDRRIKTKQAMRPSRGSVNIQDLLKEGQEVIVQVAKDPIATKGARLTCHISLPGRHLVCMPTIDHVGVSRRIDNDSERRKLRDFVDRNRPRNLGFIVRTATAAGKQQSEKRIQQDIEYLSALWSEIKEKANAVTAPALVYEDLNPVLRAIRDWVNEEIDRIVVDSRYHYNEMLRFVSHFMPTIKHKVELYQGDIPIFDAYSISTELSRALERKVWLKSGGYLVIDQAEALVAIDVNTGRFVGKKNLEDTILKTNLEAVKEIAYQLRLRNCGGIIILDLIDMEKEENKFRVYRALEEELKKDRSRPQILKISELGLIEMTRKRTRDTMVRALCDSCPHCEGKGYIKSKQTVAYEALRDLEREGIDRDTTKILVQAHADVIDALAIDERETLDQLERRYRKQIYLQAMADFHPEQFEVVSEKRSGVHRSDDKILERVRESTGTSDPRDRRGRRDRGRGKERGGRDRNREGGREGREGRNRDRDGRESREERQARRRQEQQNRISTSKAEGHNPAEETEEHQNGTAPTQPRVTIRTHAGNNGTADALPAPHDDMSEEDRLAFLRAQAAQDAALANLGVAGAPGQQERGPRNGQQPQGQGGGGRFGRDRERGGRGNRRRGRGRFQGGFRGDRPAQPAGEAGVSAAPAGGGGEDTGGGQGSGEGGGSHSTPPVT